MKTCPYCGKEYPDDAVVCAIDQQPLDPPAIPIAQTAIVAPVETDTTATARNDSSDIVFPEYRWSQRDAWKFIAVVVVVKFNWPIIMGQLYRWMPRFGAWRWGPYGNTTMDLVYAGICLLVAAFFARTDSVASFCEAVGLNRKPTEYAWLGVVAALGIRFVGHIIHMAGLARTYPDYEFSAFRHWPGPERYLFLFPLLFAAFWEESVYRGFLFKAFRGSYSVPISTSLLIGWTAYTHWNQYRHFGSAVFVISAVTAVQCWLREKSDSLWDCILCHLAFNASLLVI